MNDPKEYQKSEFVLSLLPVLLSAPGVLLLAAVLLLFCFSGSPSVLLIFSLFGLPAYLVTLVFAVTIRMMNSHVGLRRLASVGVFSSSTIVLSMLLTLIIYRR